MASHIPQDVDLQPVEMTNSKRECGRQYGHRSISVNAPLGDIHEVAEVSRNQILGEVTPQDFDVSCIVLLRPSGEPRYAFAVVVIEYLIDCATCLGVHPQLDTSTSNKKQIQAPETCRYERIRANTLYKRLRQAQRLSKFFASY